MADGPGTALCTICGQTGRINTDFTSPVARLSALEWALHFTHNHPEVESPVPYIVLAADA